MKLGSLVENKGLPLAQNIRKMPSVKPINSAQECFVGNDSMGKQKRKVFLVCRAIGLNLGTH